MIEIDGRAEAQAFLARLQSDIANTAGGRRPPCLAAILVGDDPASAVYVRNKTRTAQKIGMDSRLIKMPSETEERVLLETVAALNRDDSVDGILVQLPLPPQIREETVIHAIDPAKDVDGFHPLHAGTLARGFRPLFTPCTPRGAVMLLKTVLQDFTGLHALVIGRSAIVGRPLGQLLLLEDCTLTMAHSKTRDLPSLCRQADILAVAIGRPRFVQGSWIKPGACVLDIGINPVETAERTAKRRLCGDVDRESAMQQKGFITPVPGGVGPMTVAMLLDNTWRAYRHWHGIQHNS